ncbi:uncharacterized protein LOC134857105 [Symsagittifera roscoffensis]|uniref:uncharacterized protein LOC134857105 n=1 Tax=Symsagittifera roscoffensis TaxID=84072 RepID=UPI00307B4752
MAVDVPLAADQASRKDEISKVRHFSVTGAPSNDNARLSTLPDPDRPENSDAVLGGSRKMSEPTPRELTPQQIRNKNLILTMNGYCRTTLLRSTSPTFASEHVRRPSLSTFRPRSANEMAPSRQLERSYSEADLSKFVETDKTKEEAKQELENSRNDSAKREKNEDCVREEQTAAEIMTEVPIDAQKKEGEEKKGENPAVTDVQQSGCKIVMNIRPPVDQRENGQPERYQDNPGAGKDRKESGGNPSYGAITQQPMSCEAKMQKLFFEWEYLNDTGQETTSLIVSVEVEKIQAKKRYSCCCAFPFKR